MTIIEHKYFEHPDFVIRHLEWTAFQCIHFDKSWIETSDAFPKYEQRAFYWVDPFNAKAKDIHKPLQQKLYAKSITSMDEFYSELDKLFKPKSFGKKLKDKKKRTVRCCIYR